MTYLIKDLAPKIDHTVLQPFSTNKALDDACTFALKHSFASVCIPPFFVKQCADRLAGSTVTVCTVIGFPHGVNATTIKVKETELALYDGASEFDMVVNLSKVKDHDWEYVTADIKAVTDIAHMYNKKVKVIFENCYLNEEEKITLCKICTELECDWVKTSTGFGTSGSTIDDLKLMSANTGSNVQIKAAGGIRTLDDMIRAFSVDKVTRVGCSRTAEIFAPL